MDPVRVYFATNRNPEGPDEKPTGFGPNFSPSGLQDLRFGQALCRMARSSASSRMSRPCRNGSPPGSWSLPAPQAGAGSRDRG